MLFMDQKKKKKSLSKQVWVFHFHLKEQALIFPYVNGKIKTLKDNAQFCELLL